MTVSENVILILLFWLIFNKYESKFYFHLVVGQTTIIQMFLSTEVKCKYLLESPKLNQI